MKHTKGPWDFFSGMGGWYINSKEGKTVADAYGENKEEAKANAKLIAAAPDLLEALQDIVAYENRCRAKGDPAISDHWLDKCTDAIKKATE